jgi:hypothetical protein
MAEKNDTLVKVVDVDPVRTRRLHFDPAYIEKRTDQSVERRAMKMTNEHILCCLFEGGLRQDFMEARKGFEIIEGELVPNGTLERNEVVFYVPPTLYKILELLEDKTPLMVFGVLVRQGPSDGIKMEFNREQATG